MEGELIRQWSGYIAVEDGGVRLAGSEVRRGDPRAVGKPSCSKSRIRAECCAIESFHDRNGQRLGFGSTILPILQVRGHTP